MSGGVLVLASGPTAEKADFGLFYGWDTLTLNRPGPLWPTTMYLALDQDVVEHHQQELLAYDGEVILAAGCSLPREFTAIRCTPRKGFSLHQPFPIGHSSTYVACQLMLARGYDKIVVVGIDQGCVDGRLYSDGTYQSVSRGARIARFALEAEAFDMLPHHFDDRFLFVSDVNTWPWFISRPHCTTYELEHKI